jgi:HPt (histidine-containing phosphotransfer) domain-containing protein
MSEDLFLSSIQYDRDTPMMDREQIDMLLMVDDGDDSTALIRELHQLFVTESREKLSGLERVCMANAVGDLRKIVHFIGGSAGNLGLSRLGVFYRAIENAIDSGGLTDLTCAAGPIRREFERAVAVFEEEFHL